MGLSAFAVLIALLWIIYHFIMKWKNLKNKEVAEKMDEVKEVEDLSKTINKVDINQTKRKKENIRKFTEEF